MSRYGEIQVEFKDKDCLIEAVKQMGLNYTYHEVPQPLKDYMGHKRENTKANLILPKSNWPGKAVNEVGFAWDEEGQVKAFVDDYFTRTLGRESLLQPLTQEYGVVKGKKTARKLRMRVTREETLKDGTKRLYLKK